MSPCAPTKQVGRATRRALAKKFKRLSKYCLRRESSRAGSHPVVTHKSWRVARVALQPLGAAGLRGWVGIVDLSLVGLAFLHRQAGHALGRRSVLLRGHLRDGDRRIDHHYHRGIREAQRQSTETCCSGPLSAIFSVNLWVPCLHRAAGQACLIDPARHFAMSLCDPRQQTVCDRLVSCFR